MDPPNPLLRPHAPDRNRRLQELRARLRRLAPRRPRSHRLRRLVLRHSRLRVREIQPRQPSMQRDRRQLQQCETDRPSGVHHVRGLLDHGGAEERDPRYDLGRLWVLVFLLAETGRRAQGRDQRRVQEIDDL